MTYINDLTRHDVTNGLTRHDVNLTIIVFVIFYHLAKSMGPIDSDI